jgi:hypothetical protein
MLVWGPQKHHNSKQKFWATQNYSEHAGFSAEIWNSGGKLVVFYLRQPIIFLLGFSFLISTFGVIRPFDFRPNVLDPKIQYGDPTLFGRNLLGRKKYFAENGRMDLHLRALISVHSVIFG